MTLLSSSPDRKADEQSDERRVAGRAELVWNVTRRNRVIAVVRHDEQLLLLRQYNQ